MESPRESKKRQAAKKLDPDGLIDQMRLEDTPHMHPITLCSNRLWHTTASNRPPADAQPQSGSQGKGAFGLDNLR